VLLRILCISNDYFWNNFDFREQVRDFFPQLAPTEMPLNLTNRQSRRRLVSLSVISVGAKFLKNFKKLLKI